MSLNAPSASAPLHEGISASGFQSACRANSSNCMGSVASAARITPSPSGSATTSAEPDVHWSVPPCCHNLSRGRRGSRLELQHEKRHDHASRLSTLLETTHRRGRGARRRGSYVAPLASHSTQCPIGFVLGSAFPIDVASAEHSG